MSKQSQAIFQLAAGQFRSSFFVGFVTTAIPQERSRGFVF
jgi:hypothetical protein